MGLLSGYDSGESSDSDGGYDDAKSVERGHVASGTNDAALAQSNAHASAASGAKGDLNPISGLATLGSSSMPHGTDIVRKKVIEYSKLPMSKPLLLSSAVDEDEEAPLRRAAADDTLLSNGHLSLLASLPPPKVTLGNEVHQRGMINLDLSTLTKKDRKYEKNNSAPVHLHNQMCLERTCANPMLGEAQGAVGSDGPSAEEIEEMRSINSFTQIDAEQIRDPDWFMQSCINGGGPGLHSGKTVPSEMSMYEARSWSGTTHANPSRVQKRKHQINWLAHDAMEKEAELLDRAATSRLTKSQTQMKYGW